MRSEEFEPIVETQLETCRQILVVKAKEYANNGDRLHNFNVAAALQQSTPREALAGMMLKHTVSIYDLCKADTLASPDMWDEKITDHINYLLLLRAVVADEAHKTD